jgi:translation initiation factor 2 subunit 2
VRRVIQPVCLQKFSKPS